MPVERTDADEDEDDARGLSVIGNGRRFVVASKCFGYGSVH